MADKSVLGPFWGLASADKDKQLQSAKELISLLQNCQDEYQGNHGNGLCENLTYAVERLVRGLSSNRQGARQGFAVCLTEVLSLFSCVSVESILQLMDKHLTTTGSAKAHEERSARFGQICVLLAIVQSGRAQSMSSVTLCSLLQCFHVLANKKLYLREISVAGLVQLIREGVSILNFDQHVLPLCEAFVDGGWEQCTPETLYLLLSLQQIYGKNDSLRALLKNKLNHKHLLHTDNYPSVATVLKDTMQTHPNIHIVWPVILDVVRKKGDLALFWKTNDSLRALLKNKLNHKHLLHTDNYPSVATVLKDITQTHPNVHVVWPVVLDAVRKKGDLALFWKTVVDESLVVSSHERKYLTFKLIESLLPSLSTPEVAAVFTPNILKCLTNNLSGESNYLHKAAEHLVKSIQNAITRSADKSLRIALLLQLQSQTFVKKFDQITKSNLIGSITEQLDSDAVQLYIERLWGMLLCPNVNDDVDCYRRNMMDQIMSLFRNRKLRQLNPEQWTVYFTKMVFQQAFFNVIKAPKKSTLQCLQLQVAAPPISSDLQQILQHRFVSMLVDLANMQLVIKKGDGVTSKGTPGTDHTGEYLVRHLVDYADSLLNVANSYITVNADWPAEMNNLWSQLMGTLKGSVETDASRTSIQLLMCHAGLQLFYDSHNGTELLKELVMIYNKMAGTNVVKKGEPHWSEVLTDVLLGFLAQPSQLWRTLSKQVYRHISSHLTNEALQLIIKVLDPQHKEELHGYLQIVDDDVTPEMNGNEGDVDDDDYDDDDEEESVNASFDEASDSNSEDDDDKVECDADCEVDEEFRKDIKMALGDAAVSSNEDEGDEEDLDDDVMLKIDDALSRAFRARKKSQTTKKERKDFQKQLMDFRLRVLDLVEVYIRWQSKSINSLDLIMPLFRLTMSCSNESLSLANRAASIFTKKICHMKEYPRIAESEQDQVFVILQQLLQAAYRVPTPGQELVTQGAMFILRVLRGGRKESNALPESKHKRKRRSIDFYTNFGLINVPAVISLFNDLLTDFVTNKNSRVHQMIFTALIERYPDLGWHLSGSLCDQLPKAINHFRRGQVCEIMTSLLHQPVQLPEARKEFLLSVANNLKCFCMDYMKGGDHEKKSKYIKPIVKLLHQLIITSCKEQPEIFVECFSREELLIDIDEIAVNKSNSNSQLIVTECRKLIACLDEVGERSEHKSKKRKR